MIKSCFLIEQDFFLVLNYINSIEICIYDSRCILLRRIYKDEGRDRAQRSSSNFPLGISATSFFGRQCLSNGSRGYINLNVT